MAPATRRLGAFCEFVLSQVSPSARLLEVGCGGGELALALADAGFSVTAIDPRAPDGAIFRRVGLEGFADEAGFDAVVASLSLHHIADLGAACDKLQALLRPGGLLILEEFAKERFTGATALWYYHQRRAAAAVRVDEPSVPDDFESWRSRWEDDHADIHPLADLRTELDRRFEQRWFEWTPYLFDYRLSDALEPLERELIDAGAIEAVGCRYVGTGPAGD